ncbi:MAG: methyltransferase domain-containing protein [Gammaproteobacteria bacterium]|nr:methyltransferase domain-containing protein [Gammaproteobacteria bacterium]
MLCTDVSPAMVAVATAKAARAGVSAQVACRRLAIEDIAPQLGRFDGALSNFGALNCVADLSDAARRLASCLRPGAVAVLVIMGPGAVVETSWHLLHGRLDRAVRRWLPNGSVWRGVRITYPNPAAARRAFAPWFRTLRCDGLGVLLPPGDAAAWALRQPRQVAALDRASRALAGLPGMAWLADHYVLELERRTP